MKFKIYFTYMDGATFDIEIDPNDMEDFISCFGKGEVYFNPKRGVGLWLPLDKIRHFKMESVDGRGVRIREEDAPQAFKEARLTKEELCDAIADLDPKLEKKAALSVEEQADMDAILEEANKKVEDDN